MNTWFRAIVFFSLATLVCAPASADETEKTPAPASQKRELIYCADLMTHEERKAYRASMRAARTPQEHAERRQAHQEMMRARAQERGLDDTACEPQRLRQHGGKP